MAKEDPLDTFGRFVMVHLRDRGIDHLEGLLSGHWKAPSLKKLQKALLRLPQGERALVRRAFVAALDSAVHDFLFALQEETDGGGAVVARVRGKNVATLSDGLQGELFTEDGWYARFSAHGEPPEEA